MIFKDESIAVVMFTEDKLLLFGSPCKDQIQYLVGDDIQHILIQKRNSSISLTEPI